jgi:hypothetical protein
MMLQIRPDGVVHFTPVRVAHNVPESLAHYAPVEVAHYAPVCSIIHVFISYAFLECIKFEFTGLRSFSRR